MEEVLAEQPELTRIAVVQNVQTVQVVPDA
jgi:hypothetical protein